MMLLRHKPTWQDLAACRQAIALLRKMRMLMGRLGRQVDFTGCLDQLRIAHTHRRNFIQLFDCARFD